MVCALRPLGTQGYSTLSLPRHRTGPGAEPGPFHFSFPPPAPLRHTPLAGPRAEARRADGAAPRAAPIDDGGPAGLCSGAVTGVTSRNGRPSTLSFGVGDGRTSREPYSPLCRQIAARVKPGPSLTAITAAP